MSFFHALLTESGALTVVSVEAVPNVEVDFGVVFGSLGLPSALDVTLSDASVVSMNVTWDPGSYDENVSGSYDLTGTLTLPMGVTNPLSVVAEVTVLVAPPLFISGSDLDVLNRFIIVNFDPDVYGTGGTALQANDLQLIFSQNGGNATAASISSITQVDGSALVGGEIAVKVNLSITGDPDGLETIEIKPAASGAYEDGFGNIVSEDDTTGAVNLELELDPMYKAGVLYALNNDIVVPVRAQRLVDNALFVGWRSDTGILGELDGLHLFTSTNNAWSAIDFVTATSRGSFTGTVVMNQFIGGEVISPTTGHFDTGWNPIDDAVKFTQNDASMFCVINSNGSSAGIAMGMKGSASGVNYGQTKILPRSAADQATGAVNFNNSGNTTVASGITDCEGVHMISREASNLTRQYLNGTEIDTGTSVSSTMSNRNLTVWAFNGDGTISNYSYAHIIMLAAWGSGMQDKVTEINSRLQTWKTATTALVPSIVADKLYSWCGQSNMDRAELLTDLDAGQTTLYNQGEYLMSNTAYNSGSGFEANCYVWWDDEWQPLEPGVNGVDKGTGWFSPLFAFARAEAAKYPGEDLYFVVHAIGGTPMKTMDGSGVNVWLPGGAAISSFEAYRSKYNNAIQALTSVTAYMPFYWGQGEADCQTTLEANAYEANEITMLTEVFSFTGHTDAVVMQIHASQSLATMPYRDTVRTAKSNNDTNGEYGASGALVNIDDLTPLQDGAHLTNTNSITFGGRMSAAYP